MRTRLLTILGLALWTNATSAQTFNTISNGIARYKVATIHESEKLVDMAVLDTTKEASLESDTSLIDVDTASTLITKKSEQIGYPLSVSYPLRQSKLHVSSPFGWRRHPILGVRKFHGGVDLRATYEPVYAMLPGKVIKTGYDNVSGNYVTLEHASMRISYCHLSSINIKKGANVYAGQPLGIAGTTGRSTGVHLHLTLKVDGQQCNPMLLLKLIEDNLSNRKS